MAQNKDIEPKEISIQERVDQVFPFKKLWKLMMQLCREGTKDDPEALELVKRITFQEEFHSRFTPLNFEIDVPVTVPGGQVVEILHGSEFYFSGFTLLGDNNLNQALAKLCPEYQLDQITRSTFCEARSVASILVGTMVLRHDLKQKEIDRITKYHCLQRLIWRNPQNDLSREGGVLLLYGCLKFVANRLDKPLPK